MLKIDNSANWNLATMNTVSLEHRDVLLYICVRSDNTILKSLSCTPLWFTIREFVSTQYFWYLRTQFLMSVNLKQQPDKNWKEAYYILSHAKTKSHMFTRAASNNLLTLSILTEELDLLPGFDALLRVVEEDNIEATRLILKKRVYSGEEDDSFILTLAAEHNQVEILSLLINEGGMDPSYFQSHALELAVRRGAFEATKRLLEDSRIDPMGNDMAALTAAVEKKHNNILDLLLDDNRVRALYADREDLIRIIPRRGLHIVNSDDEVEWRPLDCLSERSA